MDVAEIKGKKRDGAHLATGRKNGKKKDVNRKKDGVCPYAKKCGGCDYQGMEYAKQLQKKQQLKKLKKK